MPKPKAKQNESWRETGKGRIAAETKVLRFNFNLPGLQDSNPSPGMQTGKRMPLAAEFGMRSIAGLGQNALDGFGDGTYFPRLSPNLPPFPLQFFQVPGNSSLRIG
jgi:hypothetical protein